MSKLTIAITLCITVPTFAEEAAIAELKAAKETHAKELVRLREKLLADIEAVLKAENDRGAGIDYLLKEKKGFVDAGVLPILPKLLPASSRYKAGKRMADEVLSKAYTSAIAAAAKAGEVKRAAELRDELDALTPPKAVESAYKLKPLVAQTKQELRAALAGTIWEWGPDGDLYFKTDGIVGHRGWEASGLVTSWEAIDRRTVVLQIEKGRDKHLHCILMFDEKLGEFVSFGFDDKKRSDPKKRKN